MGTNYYWTEREPCECCGRPFESLHIGKSSAGWNFSLHIHPDEGIVNLEDWKARWATGGTITDEYGRTISIGEMVATITKRSHPQGLYSHVSYSSQTRPVQVGGPTWDLCDYEFS